MKRQPCHFGSPVEFTCRRSADEMSRQQHIDGFPRAFADLVDNEVQILLRVDGKIFIHQLKGDKGIRVFSKLLNFLDLSVSEEPAFKKKFH